MENRTNRDTKNITDSTVSSKSASEVRQISDTKKDKIAFMRRENARALKWKEMLELYP